MEGINGLGSGRQQVWCREGGFEAHAITARGRMSEGFGQVPRVAKVGYC